MKHKGYLILMGFELASAEAVAVAVVVALAVAVTIADGTKVVGF